MDAKLPTSFRANLNILDGSLKLQIRTLTENEILAAASMKSADADVIFGLRLKSNPPTRMDGFN